MSGFQFKAKNKTVENKKVENKTVENKKVKKKLWKFNKKMLARGIVSPCGPDGRQWSLWNIAKHKPFFPTGPCDSEDFMKGGWCV